MFGLVPFSGRRGLSRNDSANPFALFDAMRDSFFHDGFPAANWGAGSFKVDVKDADDHYELTADLPGMAKEDISLNYENGYLTIAATRSESKDEKDDAGNYIRRERHTGEVSRSFCSLRADALSPIAKDRRLPAVWQVSRLSFLYAVFCRTARIRGDSFAGIFLMRHAFLCRFRTLPGCSSHMRSQSAGGMSLTSPAARASA